MKVWNVVFITGGLKEDNKKVKKLIVLLWTSAMLKHFCYN